MSIDRLPTELLYGIAGFLRLEDDVVGLSGASVGLRSRLSIETTVACPAYRKIASIDGSVYDGPPRFRYRGSYVHYGFEIPSVTCNGSSVHSVRVSMRCKDIFGRSISSVHSRCRFIVGKDQNVGDDIRGVVYDCTIPIGKVAGECIIFPVPCGDTAYHLWYICENSPIKLEFNDVSIQYMTFDRTLAKALNFLVTSQVVSSLDEDEARPAGWNDPIATHELLASSRAYTVQSTLEHVRHARNLLEKGEPVPRRVVYFFSGHGIRMDDLNTELMTVILSIWHEWARSKRAHEAARREAEEKRTESHRRGHVNTLPPAPFLTPWNDTEILRVAALGMAGARADGARPVRNNTTYAHQILTRVDTRERTQSLYDTLLWYLMKTRDKMYSWASSSPL